MSVSRDAETDALATEFGPVPLYTQGASVGRVVEFEPAVVCSAPAAGVEQLTEPASVPAAVVAPAASGYALKRPLEAMLALLGCVCLLPLGPVIAGLIWLEDRGSVFIHQVRVGRNGRPFGLIKFRTMRTALAPDVPKQATANDGRITRIGRLLRATALDEVPQLLNILRGEMSLVGPRALLPEEIEVDPRSRYHRIEEVPNYHVRISVRPGLTGLAQVYAPRDVSRQRKFRYDALYVRRASPWLDLRLFVMSVVISLTGRWPRRGRPLKHHRNAAQAAGS